MWCWLSESIIDRGESHPQAKAAASTLGDDFAQEGTCLQFIFGHREPLVVSTPAGAIPFTSGAFPTEFIQIKSVDAGMGLSMMTVMFGSWFLLQVPVMLETANRVNECMVGPGHLIDGVPCSVSVNQVCTSKLVWMVK